MIEHLLAGIAIGFFARLVVDALGGRGRVSHGHQPNTPPRDWSKVQRPQGTAVVRPGEGTGHSPNVPDVDWSKVKPPPGARSAVQPPKAGIIPGRPGVHHAPHVLGIPPMGPGKHYKPRPEDS